MSASGAPPRLEPRAAILLGWLCALAACSGPPQAGRGLGDDLGTFSVEATETQNTCGAGALGSSERYEFEVDLARAYSELFWDGRVGGEIDASLTFEFAADVRVELRAARPTEPGCAILRHDQVVGMLVEDGSAGVVGFSGEMSHGFDSEAEAVCTSTDLDLSGLPVLPCRMRYVLAAERSRTPDP